MNSIKAIIFDNGGVVLKDASKIFYMSVSKKLKIDIEYQREIFRGPLHKLVRGDITRKVFWELVFRKLKRKYDSSFVDLLYTTHKKLFEINRPVLDFAMKLKKSGYIVPMLTNTIEDHVKVSVKNGVYEKFKPLIMSSRVGMRKPSMNIYQYTLRKLGLKGKECVFIDDLKRNIKGAKKVGLNAILFKNLGQLKKDLKKLGVKV